MFGQQNNQSDQQDTQIPDQSIDGVLGDGGQQPTPVDDPGQQDDHQAGQDDQPWQHPGTPLDSAAVVNSLEVSSTIAPTITPTTVPPPAPVYKDPQDGGDTDTNDLIDIKQRALSQLSPLVGHLDQSPEDKFRTTMMMIQASDDQSLIKGAYEAAKQIEDEKTRAQALLDIVNEINYFTQHHED